MKAKSKRLLMRLVKLLRDDARRKNGIRFNLSEVLKPHKRVAVKTLSGRTIHWLDFKNWTPAANCGSVGCAIGLAAASGAFKKAGLSVGLYGKIVFQGNKIDFHTAAIKLFDLPYDDAAELFTPGSLYEGKKITGAEGGRNVANAIAAYVRRGGKLPPKVQDRIDFES